jgi:hypothetical protein
LRQVVSPDPLVLVAPKPGGRGRPPRSAGQVVAMLRQLDDWLDKQPDRAMLKDFAAAVGMDPSTVRRWLRTMQRFGLTTTRRWSSVIAFRSV